MQGRVGISLLPSPTILLFGMGIVLVAMVEDFHHTGDGREGTSQIKQFVFLQVGVLHTDADDAFSYVIEKLQGKVLDLLHQATELTHLHEPLVHFLCVAAERHLVHLFLAK